MGARRLKQLVQHALVLMRHVRTGARSSAPCAPPRAPRAPEHIACEHELAEHGARLADLEQAECVRAAGAGRRAAVRGVQRAVAERPPHAARRDEVREDHVCLERLAERDALPCVSQHGEMDAGSRARTQSASSSRPSPARCASTRRSTPAGAPSARAAHSQAAARPRSRTAPRLSALTTSWPCTTLVTSRAARAPSVGDVTHGAPSANTRTRRPAGRPEEGTVRQVAGSAQLCARSVKV
jgi:hypothetical protein